MTIKEAIDKGLNVARRTNHVAGRLGKGQLIEWDCGCKDHAADGQTLCARHSMFPEPFLPKNSWRRNEQGMRNVIALEDAGNQGECWVELDNANG